MRRRSESRTTKALEPLGAYVAELRDRAAERELEGDRYGATVYARVAGRTRRGAKPARVQRSLTRRGDHRSIA